MKTTSTVIGALGLLALAAGCAVDAAPQEEVGSNEEAVACSNDGATFAVLAGMAVASGKEMRRWLPQRDFECTSPYTWEIGTDLTGNNGGPDGVVDQPGKCIRRTDMINPYGDPNADSNRKPWRMWTSPKGRARCPNGNCRNVHALMNLQGDLPAGAVPFLFGGQQLNHGTLRTRLYSYWQRQFTCINAVDNHTGDNCPVETHDLAFWYKTTSSVTCDGGYDFWFHSYKMGTLTPLQYPHQLKNMLIWAGGTDNPFLQFNNVNGDVKIDPVGGTAEDSSPTSGSCPIVSYSSTLNKCGQTYSATSLIGSCCVCNGKNSTYIQGSLTDYYRCQTPL